MSGPTCCSSSWARNTSITAGTRCTPAARPSRTGPWSESRIDPDRLLFLGHIEPEQLAEVLCQSDLHLYLTVPFVLSWSLLNAMACGCVVLGSDVPPVREVIEPGVTGLVEPLFDVDRLTATALRRPRRPGHVPPARHGGPGSGRDAV